MPKRDERQVNLENAVLAIIADDWRDVPSKFLRTCIYSGDNRQDKFQKACAALELHKRLAAKKKGG